ncbi:MAG: hypothetical protein PVI80_17585, partial [Anaerolineae bacterium]
TPACSTGLPPSQFAEAWEKTIQERRAALAKLPATDQFPPNATTWRDYAQHTLDDLLTYDDCWFVEPSTGIRGFRPYVKGADCWGGASRTREITELMAEMDVLWPMYRYLQLHPEPETEALVEEFIGELPKYYNPVARQSTNRPGETRHDSWYFMENSVLKYGHLYLISENPELREPYLGSLGSALEMAHNFDYLFPQFVDIEKQRAGGYNTNNYSTAGLLAYSLIHAYQLTGDSHYLHEAERALLSMYANASPLELLYEPQELAAAASAAAHLTEYATELGSTTNWSALAQRFFYAQAWMIYYDGGQTDLPGFRPQRSDWLPETWRDGLHAPYYNPVEAGGINAPAFKENLEAVLFWTDYLRYLYGQPGFDPVEPLKVLNLNRIKNFYFFSANIPDEWERDYGPVTLQYIPYEDIDYYAVREHEDRSVREKAGYNGKEIYGAGEALWAYLAFEALGRSGDRNALILNLNLFDTDYPPVPENRAYIVFNPYHEDRTLTFTLLHLELPHTLYADGQELGDFQPDEPFEIALPGLGSALLTLEAQP